MSALEDTDEDTDEAGVLVEAKWRKRVTGTISRPNSRPTAPTANSVLRAKLPFLSSSHSYSSAK